MYKYATRIVPFFAGLGFAIWKSEPYGYRNTNSECRIEAISFIPIVNIVFGIPMAIGYVLGKKHDKLLYYWNPTYYQNEIDEYGNMQRGLRALYLESQKGQIIGGGTGNPQITFFE